jgi:integrase/recombinase XerD
MKKKQDKRRLGLGPDKYLAPDQVDMLMRHLDRAAMSGSNRSAVNKFICMVGLYSGLRAEEMMALRIEDTPYYHGKPVIDVKRGKGGRPRSVIIPDWLCNAIAEFIRTRRAGAKPGSALIASERDYRIVTLERFKMVNGIRVRYTHKERSARMTYSALYYRLRLIGHASGVGRLSPHVLRHTFSMRLKAVSRDIQCVQLCLGHSDVKTTSIYARTMDEGIRGWVNAVQVWGLKTINIQENIDRLEFMRWKESQVVALKDVATFQNAVQNRTFSQKYNSGSVGEYPELNNPHY